ncbi:FtsX-like permease family protein [Streptomyces fuscigenes]|uniref:FtsX-like permease family protein n=1 Tax=Streptomyces fuscigenes TaxID=1528880 RepID=UPI001F24CFFE|nr:ABC transporter permease [Streptomyces fuscigenes]MCF3964402.1 ABC transporter permease [Streptomyces fuscigenes]
MTTWYRSWRVALRIARRDAWRFKGRSFLVLAMIALPILGVSALDLTLRSSELTPSETLTRDIGAADARVKDLDLAGVPILQDPASLMSYTTAKDYGDKSWPDGPGSLAKALPAGARTLTDSSAQVSLRTTHGILDTEVRELASSDPMAKGILRPVDGRLPRSAHEVAATTHFLASSGLKVGSELTARDLATKYRIVGSYELPSALGEDQVNALPGALLKPLAAALAAKGLPPFTPDSSHLVAVPGGGGFTWNMVQAANAHGFAATSRAVTLHPPARADVPYFRQSGQTSDDGSDSAVVASILATIVGLAMLEICLLAGPAFAVGARRSRRQLGLVGANGGDRRHIRAIVLGGGVVIGVASAVIGTVLGLALTYALRPVLEDAIGKRFGSFTVRPAEILAIAGLAVLTGVLAAIMPAVTASRQTVLASLTGRRGVRRSSRVLPVLGLIAVVIGAAIALYGSTVSDRSVIVVGGSALAELGFVALTPALVGLFGRLGGLLPLSPRLALRDSVRNRGRTAPAVAAVLAAVAGTVAVSTYTASSDAQSRAEYRPQLPYGAVSVLTTEDGGRDVPAARAAVVKSLPVRVRADVDRIQTGKPSCDLYSSEPGCGHAEIVVPKANQCPLWTYGDAGADREVPMDQRRKLAKDPRCQDDSGSDVTTGMLVGGASVLRVLGIHDPAAERALAAGQVVSLSPRNVSTKGGHDTVSLRIYADGAKEQEALDKGRTPASTVTTLPAHTVASGTNAYGEQLLMTPATARAAHLSTVPYGAYYTTGSLPTGAQEQKANGAVADLGGMIDLHIEKGYTSKNNIVLLALGLFAGLITVGAAGIATGLAQTDAEADLKTLAAVGAPDRVRRTLSGFQCGVVAAMGVILGSLAGVLPSIGLRLSERRDLIAQYKHNVAQGSFSDALPHVPIVVPWGTMLALLVAVPVGAALLAAAVTRSQRSLSRRAAT